MAKLGDKYRELVGTVAAALEPGSTVKTEQYIKGPDGERDMDVEMRGMLNGKPQFVLIECKDHARPIGIGYVDAFESKVRDLKPDRAIVFSNSGFTRDALRKAKRVGIEMASAMKAKDRAIRMSIHQEIVAKRISVQMESVTIFPYDGHTFDFEEEWRHADLTFDGLPVTNWIDHKMKAIAIEQDESKSIKYLCTFHSKPGWVYQGRPIMIGGLTVLFKCIRDWVSQKVSPNVSLGYYDHIRKRITVPSNQGYLMGFIDNNRWVETDQRWEHVDMELNHFQLFITLITSNLPNSKEVVPMINELIFEQRIDIL